MKYLLFFLTFFKIGLTSFGGGYGMISIIRETVLNNGWESFTFYCPREYVTCAEDVKTAISNNEIKVSSFFII